MTVPAEGVCSGYDEVKNIRTWDGRALWEEPDADSPFWEVGISG